MRRGEHSVGAVQTSSGTSPAHGHSGFRFDDLDPASAWIAEGASIRLPPLAGPCTLVLRGRFIEVAGRGPLEGGMPSMLVGSAGSEQAHWISLGESGERWSARITLGKAEAKAGAEIRCLLNGVGLGNALAWLGRKTGLPALSRFRSQRRNRCLRIERLDLEDGTPVCDFSQRGTQLAPAFLRSLSRQGLNVIGWLDAELGLGEGARCMLRAAKAAGLPAAPLQLLIPCRAARGNTEFPPGDAAPHPVNVFHVDPPAAPEIDRRHGPALRQGRRNIAYWAWELEDFPDAWIESFAPFDEIWCPSEFTRRAIAAKSPLPVLVMPHALQVPPRPDPRECSDTRRRLGLPSSTFLFLFAYDLNSTTGRKNPEAVLRAFELADFPHGAAGLVIKVHGAQGRPAELEDLRARVLGIPGASLLETTLPRRDFDQLMAACDCFVSLHRAEGFGLAVAEAMALGKPVIATDWSATAEFLDRSNGMPVRYSPVPVGRNEGPYPANGYWAEADAEDAARCMRTLSSDRALAMRLGEAARATIASRFSPERIGALYRRRLDAIALFPKSSPTPLPGRTP